MPIEKSISLELKNKLIEEKLRLEEELNKITTHKQANGDYETIFNEIGSGEDENASEVEEYTDNLALENSLEKQLKDTVEALQKIEEGKYGFCENCSKEIAIERLIAYPSAKKCIVCK
jgi:RNA polymerase-binding transcription factor DksA